MTARVVFPRAEETARAWADRRAGGAPEGGVLSDLLAGRPVDEIAARRGMREVAVDAVRSFYDALGTGTRVCDGTACHFGGAGTLAAALREQGPVGAVRCLGHCHAAPAFRTGDLVCGRPSHLTVERWIDDWGDGVEPHEDLARVPRRALAPEPVVLRNLLGARPPWMAEYELPDGEAILAALEAAGLRGRGGAAFPTAAKWRVARDTPADQRWVVANGDEGDPGSYVDRLLLEEDPHAVLAGMVACARTIGAERGVVYVRHEYPRAQASVVRAIHEAAAAGVLGDLEVRLLSGAGSYVCGEETALLASIEGRRGEPRPKPPFPAQSGLFGKPTVVQNVETLAVVPWIARNRRGAGTKAASLSGAIRRPGLVEIVAGTPLARVLEEAGGGAPEGRRWGMALVGGPMGRVLRADRFDTPLSYEALPGMGHAGVVVLDDTVSPRELALHLFAFARAESCGSCAPCRIGTTRLAATRTRGELERLLETLEIGSLCGFGQAVPRPIRDLLEQFGEAVLA